MKQFNFYDVIGVIAPGMVVVVGMAILFFPEQNQSLLLVAKVSVGGLGLGIILAYVAGQIVQVLGNGLEWLWWMPWGGMPTDWVRSGKFNILAPRQKEMLKERIRRMLAAPDFEYAACTQDEWYSITRQVNAAVAVVGRTGRSDVFNGVYGLCRGIASAFALLLMAALLTNWHTWRQEIALLILTCLSLLRMHRLGIRYAREIFVQCLTLSENQSSGGK